MITVNGRSYRLARQPTVVVCVDGCEPDYIAQAVGHGQMPWLNKVLGTGTALQKKEAGHKAAAQALENKKLMRVYETKKKAFQEALAAAQESETPRP